MGSQAPHSATAFRPSTAGRFPFDEISAVKVGLSREKSQVWNTKQNKYSLNTLVLGNYRVMDGVR